MQARRLSVLCAFVVRAVMIALLFGAVDGVFAQVGSDISSRLCIIDADDNTVVQILRTRDGATNIGRIIAIGDTSIQFNTSLGTLSIPIALIADILEVPATAIKHGVYWFPNPNATRLLFSPTGFMLQKGEGNFADYYLFFPGFSFGITSNITIAGGVSIFPGLDLNEQLFYGGPKVGFSASDELNFAVGALLLKVPFDGEATAAGIIYGVATKGNPDGSVTAGIGYGFYDCKLAERPVIVLGGEWRLSRNIAVVSENWFFPGLAKPVLSAGIRFFGERLSTDIALVKATEEGTPVFPWVDFVFSFGP